MNTIPTNKRKELNDKVLYLIDSNETEKSGLTPEDLFNAYTGDGGLHELKRNDYANYSDFSQAKKEVETGSFLRLQLYANLLPPVFRCQNQISLRI